MNPYLDNQYFGSEGPFNTYIDSSRYAPIVFSRSCPYLCTFCDHSIKTYRLRKFDKAFKEIDALVDKYNINGLLVNDDLFAVSRKRASEFSKRIYPYDLHWFAQLRVNIAEPELMKEMREAKCLTVSYGFESMDEHVLKSMRKKVKPHHIENAARVTYEAYISIQANFIFGDSQETIETVNKTMNWWARNRRYYINLSEILLSPGTELYQTAVERGLIADPYAHISRGCPPINTTLLPLHEFSLFRSEMVMSCSLHIPAHVENISQSPDGGHYLQVTVICPHCGQPQTYSSVSHGKLTVMCRKCCGRLHMEPRSRGYNSNLVAHKVELLTQAIQWMKEHNWQDCTSLIQKVRDETPSDFNALYLLGTAQLLMGKYEDAKASFRYAFGTFSTVADIQNNYGVALCVTGQIGWGLLRFQQALAIDPNCIKARGNAKKVNTWLADHKFKDIPFVQLFASEQVRDLGTLQVSIPSLSPITSPALWPPLRTSTEHPWAGNSYDEFRNEVE